MSRTFELARGSVGVVTVLVMMSYCSACFAATISDDKLVFVSVIRVPGVTTPSDPHELNLSWLWDHPVNQLSSDGILQDFSAGQKLRWLLQDLRNVMNPQGLISAVATDVGSTLQVFSSDDNVHVQSAQALLRGLYGQRDKLQTVPIHPTDDLDAHMQCETVQRLKNRVSRDPRWIARAAEEDAGALVASLRSNFPHAVSSLSAEAVLKKLPELSGAFRSVAASRFNVSDALPSLPGKTAERIMWDSIRFSDWAESRPYMWKEYDQIGYLTGGRLLNTILRQMEARLRLLDGAPTVSIFSARRDNLMGILTLLKATSLLSSKPPGFGSQLVFRVTNSSTGVTRVTLEYFGETVEMPACKSPCSLSNFKLFLDRTLPKESWDLFCESTIPYCQGVDVRGDQLPFLSLLPMWTVAGVLLGLLSVGLIALIVSRYRRNKSKQSRRDAMMTVEI